MVLPSTTNYIYRRKKSYCLLPKYLPLGLFFTIYHRKNHRLFFAIVIKSTVQNGFRLPPESVTGNIFFYRLLFEKYRSTALPSCFVTVFKTVTAVYPEPSERSVPTAGKMSSIHAEKSGNKYISKTLFRTAVAAASFLWPGRASTKPSVGRRILLPGAAALLCRYRL